MKNSCICPKCDGRTCYAVEWAKMAVAIAERKVVTPVQLTTCSEELRFADATRDGPHGVHVEAWVCAGCAYTELYALELETLAAMAAHGELGVRTVEARADRGPHR